MLYPNHRAQAAVLLVILSVVEVIAALREMSVAMVYATLLGPPVVVAMPVALDMSVAAMAVACLAISRVGKSAVILEVHAVMTEAAVNLDLYVVIMEDAALQDTLSIVVAILVLLGRHVATELVEIYVLTEDAALVGKYVVATVAVLLEVYVAKELVGVHVVRDIVALLGRPVTTVPPTAIRVLIHDISIMNRNWNLYYESREFLLSHHPA